MIPMHDVSVRFACWFSQFSNEPDTKLPAPFRSSDLGSSGWQAWNTVFLSRRTALLYQRPFIQFKMASVEAFECDPDFCPRCGSILPLPGLLEVVSCTLCNFQKDTSGKSMKKFLDSNESNELSQSFQHACAASWVSRQSSKHPEN